MKKLFLDIETAPMVGPAWRAYDTNLIEVWQEQYILQVGYMWEGESEASILSLQDYRTTFRADHTDDYRLVRDALSLIEQADMIIAHNLPFDWGHISGQALIHKLPPPPLPVMQCTLQMAKKFRLRSRKLDDLCERLLQEGKIKHRGFAMWRDCMDGDLAAFEEMGEYCKRDVELLPGLYDQLTPWYGKNVAAFTEGVACTKCGSSSIIKHSIRDANTSVQIPKFALTPGGIYYRYYKCNDCGGFSKSRTMSGKSLLK